MLVYEPLLPKEFDKRRSFFSPGSVAECIHGDSVWTMNEIVKLRGGNHRLSPFAREPCLRGILHLVSASRFQGALARSRAVERCAFGRWRR